MAGSVRRPGDRLPQRVGKLPYAQLGVAGPVSVKLFPAERALILHLRELSTAEAERVTARLFLAAGERAQ